MYALKMHAHEYSTKYGHGGKFQSNQKDSKAFKIAKVALANRVA